MLRVGEGYDVHRLVEGRPFRLGLIEIDHDRGPLGHSDGDAVAHALCDALFGAAALGDIGTHFSPRDERWKDADSAAFVRAAAAMLDEHGWTVVNVDITVVTERPRLAPHIASMRAALAAALGCDVERVSVKAKTAEGLGEIGRNEAIEARCVALVESG